MPRFIWKSIALCVAMAVSSHTTFAESSGSPAALAVQAYADCLVAAAKSPSAKGASPTDAVKSACSAEREALLALLPPDYQKGLLDAFDESLPAVVAKIATEPAPAP